LLFFTAKSFFDHLWFVSTLHVVVRKEPFEEVMRTLPSIAQRVIEEHKPSLPRRNVISHVVYQGQRGSYVRMVYKPMRSYKWSFLTCSACCPGAHDMAKATSTVSTTVRPVPILPKPGTSSSGLASSSRNMSLDERNVTRQMMEYFPGRECGSFVEFEYKLREFQRGTGTCYARRHSLSAAKYGQNVGEIITPSVGYAFMVYKCVHARSHWNASKKGRRYADFDCRSFMRVVHRDGRLVIVSYNMQHTHDLRRCEWQVYAANRHLNAEQERVVFGLLRCFKSSMEIRDYVRKNYGIDLTGDDVRVLRDKLRRLDYPVCDLQGIRDALRPFGPMAVPLPHVRQPKLDYR
ncbi:hypothetical protein CLF_113365, partial [Clonorchis sinensis]